MNNVNAHFSENVAGSRGALPSALTDAPASFEEHAAEHACVEPLRILHVITRFDTGGTEYGMLKVANGLSKTLFAHKICTTRGYNPDVARQRQLEDQLFVAGTQYGNLEFPIFRLARIMRTYKPHIVHSRNWGAIEAIPAARLAGVPIVIHSEHGYELDMLAGLPYRRRILRRVFYPMADAVFAVTEDLKRFHLKQAWVAADRIRVIYNGVDTDKFAPNPELRRRVRDALGIGEDVLTLGTVGRLVGIKDHSTLLRAAKTLVNRGINVRVLLAGSGPERQQLEQLVAASVELFGRVSFLGSREDVAEVFQAMDVFVLPSICEGFSNTLLEAMASGVATIATRVGGNAEVVEEGRSGWLFPAGDDVKLAGLLEKLALQTALRRELGAAGRYRAVSCFALKRMMDDYHNLYWDLACQRGLRLRS